MPTSSDSFSPRKSFLSRLRAEWPQFVIVGAMAGLCVVGYWAGARFPGIGQGLEGALADLMYGFAIG